MRICILGAGALGSAIGGVLAEAGHDVTLISRNRAHIDAVNTGGLMLRSDGRDRSVRLAAAVATAGFAPVDLVVVLVKSRDTREAIQSARHLIAPETVVMSLQNGLGQEDVLADVIGARHVIAGKTYVGGVMLGPGHVLASTTAKQTIIGEMDGALSPRVIAIAEAFTLAGLETLASTTIMGAMWDKLLVNIATGAVAAITGLTYGDLYALPEIEQTAIAAVAEGLAVAKALGIAVATSDPLAPWRTACVGLPAEFRTSMLQSLDKGSLTEIDVINGAVVQAGAKVGVPTPVNATLVALIKGVERRLVPSPAPPHAYLEHVAIRVRDIQWHIRFFETVFGWKVRQRDGDEPNPKQVWIGGMQLISAPEVDGLEGRVNHLGMRCGNVDAAMQIAYSFEGVSADPRGRNWIVLPEGFVVELLPASETAVATALSIHPEL